MTKLPEWFTKIQAVWATIGSLLVLLGFTSPEWLPELFSQGFIDAFAVALGAVITFYQYVRALFAKDQVAEVTILSAGQKLAYALNPFKLVA